MEVTESQRVKWIRRAARTLAVVALAIVAYLVLAPTGRYLLRAAWEEGKILSRRRPIAQLVADSTTSPELRAKLRLVLAAREYAHDSLGLEAGQSFTTYSRLDRDTLVLVLSGAYRDKLKARTWWFPVVGRVPYKGYFDFGAARAAERALTAEGFDARLGAASAFSTLGWFNDPLLPTTLRADSLSVANTVIHELTHNTFYAPGGAVFNESFANFVGARGAERFFRSRGQTVAAQTVVDRWEDEKVIGRFWASLYARVDSAFKRLPGEEPAQVAVRIAVRDSIYARARTLLHDSVGPQLRTMKVGAVQRIRIDNAVLMARRVYLTNLDSFDAVLARHGGDLRATIETIIDAAKEDREHPFDAVRALAHDAVARDSVPRDSARRDSVPRDSAAR